MKTHRLILAALAGSLLAACGTSSPVGLIDVQRIASNWPEYQSDQAHLSRTNSRSLPVGHPSPKNGARPRDCR